jgi:hypothetical protein
MHRGAVAPLAYRLVTPKRSSRSPGAVCQQSVSHPPCSATRGIAWPPALRQLSWSDAVRDGAAQGDVRGPHSLHTAEATGSKPVTPTSTNRLLRPPSRCLAPADCQQTTFSRLRDAQSTAHFEGLDSRR